MLAESRGLGSGMLYRTISMDPPWLERGGGKIKRGADRHYELMSLPDIHRTIVMSGSFTPADDAHLYVWVTNNFLPQGLELMRLLGFRYVTNTVWCKMRLTHASNALRELADKMKIPKTQPVQEIAQIFYLTELAASALQIGLGQFQRGAHELVLFGVKGDAMVPEPEHRLPSVVFAPRTKHSAKPACFYERIEKVSPGPYLEMFAREKRESWDVWGNEAPQ